MTALAAHVDSASARVAGAAQTDGGARLRLELRPYQRACVDALFAWVGRHDGNPLLVIPTGGGKSLTMATIIGEALANAPEARALVLAHRKELIQQNTRAVLTRMPVTAVGIYSAGLKRKDRSHRVIVGGIQSVARNPYSLGAFDLVLVDEAHLVPTSDDTLYRKTIDALKLQNPNVRFVGLTATPYRMGSGLLHRGKHALFTDIAYEAGVGELVTDGYLCRLVSRGTAAHLNTQGVAMRGGDFVGAELEKAVDREDTTREVVEETLRLAEGRNRILVFCSGVSHAEHVADEFLRQGAIAKTVHGGTAADEREWALAAFRTGALRVLTSMDVLTTGYDEPAIDCIVLLRPTRSTGLYVQMVGRGFRLHPSKENTLVLDFAQNVARHGPVDRLTLEDAATGPGTGGQAPTKQCPTCDTIVHAAVRTCEECGHAFPPPERPPILPIASTLPILATEPEWVEVTEVEYFRHEKLEGTPSLRVEYYGGFNKIATEWVCLEHDGFARDKAEQWWRRRGGTIVPADVEAALPLARKLPAPVAIAIVRDGRWWRVVDVRFAEGADPVLPASPTPPAGALPRACWSCQFMSTTLDHSLCLRAGETPPAEVQQQGCELWTEATDSLPF